VGGKKTRKFGPRWDSKTFPIFVQIIVCYHSLARAKKQLKFRKTSLPESGEWEINLKAILPDVEMEHTCGAEQFTTSWCIPFFEQCGHWPKTMANGLGWVGFHISLLEFVTRGSLFRIVKSGKKKNNKIIM